MKKLVVTAMAIVIVLSLGACQQDPVMDELQDNTELDQPTKPDENEDEADPWDTGNGGEGGSGY